jgi:hypothetical protein
MNSELLALSERIGLAAPERRGLRLAFGLACAQRVRHLIENERALVCIDVLAAYVTGRAGEEELARAADEITAIAGSHRGSNSIDGSAHAAVSATYGAANALAGKSLDAAGYTAYAAVYAYGGYAVSDPGAFTGEFEWQVAELSRLAGAGAAP